MYGFHVRASISVFTNVCLQYGAAVAVATQSVFEWINGLAGGRREGGVDNLTAKK